MAVGIMRLLVTFSILASLLSLRVAHWLEGTIRLAVRLLKQRTWSPSCGSGKIRPRRGIPQRDPTRAGEAMTFREVLAQVIDWPQQDKQAEARALLAPTCTWFTEGFDTAELQEARTLLDALA